MQNYKVVPYFGIRNGPGCPQTVLGHLREFIRAPRLKKWYSSYSSVRGEILLVHYSFGPLKWGLHLVHIPNKDKKDGHD